MKIEMLLRLFRCAFVGLWLLVVSALKGETVVTKIYVSVDGSAQADGSLAKPYGFLQAIVEAVRAFRKSGNTDPAVILY